MKLTCDVATAVSQKTYQILRQLKTWPRNHLNRHERPAIFTFF